MLITLRPPSSEHWNIKSDLMLTVTMETYKQRREAKRAEQDPERESVGAKASPKEAPVPAKALQAVASDHTPGGKRFGDHPQHHGMHSCPPPPDNT